MLDTMGTSPGEEEEKKKKRKWEKKNKGKKKSLQNCYLQIISNVLRDDVCDFMFKGFNSVKRPKLNVKHMAILVALDFE